jgi:hypothetical protein
VVECVSKTEKLEAVSFYFTQYQLHPKGALNLTEDGRGPVSVFDDYVSQPAFQLPKMPRASHSLRYAGMHIEQCSPVE